MMDIDNNKAVDLFFKRLHNLWSRQRLGAQYECLVKNCQHDFHQEHIITQEESGLLISNQYQFRCVKCGYIPKPNKKTLMERIKEFFNH